MENNLDASKVLVIDDEQSLRDGAERILTRMDFLVEKASRGDEGLETLKTYPASIVLLDMKMPGMDGMEVLKLIMEMNRGILVIVITGFATVETAIEAMKHGAYDFIPKPYEPDQLRIVVNRARERIQLKLDTEKLEKERLRTLSDLHTEQSRVHTIIESLPNGVLVTNTEGQVVLINPAFCQHMGLEAGIEPGRQIEEYVSNEKFCELVMDISKGKYIDYDDIPSHELGVSVGKYLIARARPVLGEKRECLGAVVNLADISAMKALDQLKSEFIAKVSHELRSPLSTIHEQIAMVIKDISGEIPEDDQHILARAQEKTMGLITTISDLLDLSRLEAGIGARNPQNVQVEKLLKSIVDFMDARIKAKNLTLTLEISEDQLAPVLADPMSLESVYGNLISNSINYTPEGGEIKVTADMSGNNLRVIVKDNGFGIDAKYTDKIFERFYRVKNNKTRFITGTGLGLPIVKEIVDSLDGFIDVDSEVNKGTSFTVILPTEKSKSFKGIM